jgi:predicted alpha/beta-fold hydrolase
MPFIHASTYKASPFLKNGHLNTVYAALFRKVKGVSYKRERLELPDGDFLDLDWSGQFMQKKLALVIHGMEGNSHRAYIKGMVKLFNSAGWDGLALNLRGCGGEPNRLPRAYHMGVSDDLNFVLDHILRQRFYEHVVLIGFSLGGNIILKYLGERGVEIPPELKHAVTFSVPCHLSTAAAVIERPENTPYVWRFLRTLNPKMKHKARLFPELLSAEDPMPRNLREFDERFTAPLHGFSTAMEYYTNCGSAAFLRKIAVPTLLVNALDDPFLSRECFPRYEAEHSAFFFLETPSFGGHVGFTTFDSQKSYWSERRALHFVLNTC